VNCREWSKLGVEWRYLRVERRWTRRSLRSDVEDRGIGSRNKESQNPHP